MPFVIPEFLQNYSTEKILSEMLQKLPENISKEENGWVCDLFYPVAIAFSRAIEFTLVEAIKMLYQNILMAIYCWDTEKTEICF